MNNNKIEFQIYDWLEDHDKDKNYIIHIFGRCLNSKSVYVKLTGFKPYFYILLPNEIQVETPSNIDTFSTELFKFIETHIKFNKIKVEIKIEQHKNADGFNNDKKFWFIRVEAFNYYCLRKYKNYLENNEITLNIIKNHKFKLYEANLPPMLRCFHLKKISGCSWVKIKVYELIKENKASRCDIELHVKWEEIIPITKETNAPFIICSFDIECNSIDGEFPRAVRDGDKIIQIGYTYTELGESKPYRQYIACLDDKKKYTADLEEHIIIERFKTEEELLRNFMEEINNHECDIITGYNIYFFDEKYIYDRCTKLGLPPYEFSKLLNHKCKFKEGMKLSSAALGENTLSIWSSPGRIHIDLMKDVQRSYNLSSYRLDYVASNFIKGNITNINKLENKNVELYCDNVNDINIQDYIHIEIFKGVVADEIGSKYLVTDIDNINNKIIIIDKDDNLLNISLTEYKLCWSQAKDDITPKDIFASYKGSSKDRAKIAKYCIKDCVLVNVLINKLEVIAKNIEMANVCFVPLSYLFVRGQGIKIFSLCLKEYNTHGYLFPVLIENKSKCITTGCKTCKKEYINLYQCPECSQDTEQEEFKKEAECYEGAIVFEPIPSVEYEGLAVKDYASLYPSSIIQKNISHETFVEHDHYIKKYTEYIENPINFSKKNKEYSNVEYYTASYKDNLKDANKICIFAKKDNKLGVLPSILNNLLNERKNIKYKMKSEKVQFKYKLLNVKQLAIKITANSLYGQLGSMFSHIKKQELAASTTATGREMLIFAKNYDEEYLPYVINTLKYYYNKNDNNGINKLYEDKEFNIKNISDTLKENIKIYIKSITNLTIQPIIRYGDTDSIFSCYRFKENTILLEESEAIKIWDDVIKFSYELIAPFLDEETNKKVIDIFKKEYLSKKVKDIFKETYLIKKDKDIFDEYEINELIIPIIKDNNSNINKFIKEYMEKSYLPLLWTLVELVEKNNTEMFDNKLLSQIIQMFEKHNIKYTDLHLYKKNTLCNYLENKLLPIINNNIYTEPTIDIINKFTLKVIKEILKPNKIDYLQNDIKLLCKSLLSTTIKDKWEFSIYNKTLHQIVNEYFTNIILDYIKSNDDILSFIKVIINKKVLYEDNIKNELSKYKLNLNKFDKSTKLFIDTYNKYNGRKSINEIIQRFIQTDLKLDFNIDKVNHYNNIIEFITSKLRKDDMSIMTDTKVYIYYWIHSRWKYINTNKKEIRIDIYEGGNAITDKRTVEYTINLGKLSGQMIKLKLEDPHDCEYEKTYWPFIILKKKKYVGNKYENNPDKFNQDSTGIVLKRRDNAPIVKELCNGVINYLINYKDVKNIKNYIQTCIQDMFDNKYNIKYFLQSRSLKSKTSYKDWTRIAHVVLADRIMKRDPGNILQSGTRLEYAVVITDSPNKKKLQGEIIESYDYIKSNNLKIDYLFYLTNQLMNPILQFLELIDKKSINIFNEYINYYSLTAHEKLEIKVKNCIKRIKQLPNIKKTIRRNVFEIKAILLLLKKNNIENKERTKTIINLEKFIKTIFSIKKV